MPREAYAANYYDNYAFLVRIDGFVRAGFSEVSGLEAEAEVIEHHEGGNLTAHKSPGKINYGNITLSRGETDNLDMYNWWKQCHDVQTGYGEADMSVLKKNIIIEQLDRSGKVLKKWRVYGAWPSAYRHSDWSGDGSEKNIETMELVNDGFEPVLQ